MLDKIDLNEIEKIAIDAGKAIMEIYKKDFDIEYKDDTSPLTEADLKANQIICSALEEKYPNIPIMSEENKQTPYSIRKNWEYYWCIDPIDGTKEFIKKNDEFTINIALMYKNEPVLGVHNNNPKEKLSVVASKSHLSEETQQFIDALDSKHITQVSKGSSLKLCMVAEGIADIYPRLAPTMEWDTAAADAIVRESGKMTYQYNTKEPMVYNKENLLNPWFIVQ